jgi:hypothetical protein
VSGPRRFAALYWINRELLDSDPDFRAEARRDIEARLSVPLKGPRGGQYEGFGEIKWSEEPAEGYRADGAYIKGKRWAKYVRPQREATA